MENCAQFETAQCKKDEEEPGGSSGGLATDSGSQSTCPMSRGGRSWTGFT